MNPVQLAINYIKREIPADILNEAFTPRTYNPSRTEYFRDNQIGNTLDQQLTSVIIKGWVGVDVNLCSGMSEWLDLSRVSADYIDTWNRRYIIPDTITRGREITSIYHVGYADGNAPMYGMGADVRHCGSSELTNAMGGFIQAEKTIPIVATARAEVVGRNIVHISDSTALASHLYLHCLLTHEPEFSNIKPAYSRYFARLCVLAAKAYVYRELPIRLDEGFIKYGASLGRFREYVDGYSDANDQYQDMLQEEWRKVSMLNDTVAHRRYLTMITGGRN